MTEAIARPTRVEHDQMGAMVVDRWGVVLAHGLREDAAREMSAAINAYRPGQAIEDSPRPPTGV